MDVSYDATKRELATDKGVIVYHEAGDPDAPPLILLHGSGPGVTGWRNYRNNLGFFAQTHRTFIVEFPGFGVSEPVEGHPVLTAGSSVTRFMDGLGIESAAMIGNSSALPIVFVSEALISFCGLVYNITQVSARQALCPEHLLGRMNASIRFFVWGVMPISALAAGAFASGFGMVPVMLVGAIGAMTASWFVFASPLRGMRNIVAEAAK